MSMMKAILSWIRFSIYVHDFLTEKGLLDEFTKYLEKRESDF